MKRTYRRWLRRGATASILGFLACASPDSEWADSTEASPLAASPILRPGESLGTTYYTLTFGALGSGSESLDGTGLVNAGGFEWPPAKNLRLFDPLGRQADGVYEIAYKNARASGLEHVTDRIPTDVPAPGTDLFGGGKFDGTGLWLGHSRFLPGKGPAPGVDSPPGAGVAWNGTSGVTANGGSDVRGDAAHKIQVPVAQSSVAQSAFVISAQIFVPSHGTAGHLVTVQPAVERAGHGLTSPGGSGFRTLDFTSLHDKWNLVEIRVDLVTDGGSRMDTTDDWGTVSYTYFLNGQQVGNPDMFEFIKDEFHAGTGPMEFSPSFALLHGWQGNAPEAVIDNVSVTKINQPRTAAFRTSWVGETVLPEDAAKTIGEVHAERGERGVPKGVAGIWADPVPNAAGDVLIYANTLRDEGLWHTAVFRYQKGLSTIRPFARMAETGHSGGLAVTGDDEFVYMSFWAGTDTNNQACIGRYRKIDVVQDAIVPDLKFSQTGGASRDFCVAEAGHHFIANSIRGLAVSPQLLFASYRNVNENTGELVAQEIHVYDKKNWTAEPLAKTFVPSPGGIAYSPVGSLWVIVDGQLPGVTEPPPYVQEYTIDTNRTLKATPRRVTGLRPTGVTVDKNGRLYVTDDAPGTQQVRVYDTNASSTTVVEIPAMKLGDPGGVLANPRGAYGPARFDGPVAISVDNEGNYYVANDGWGATRGTEMMDVRRFNPSKQLEAIVVSHPYQTSVVPDPRQRGDFYSVDHKYTLDLDGNVAPGGEWSLPKSWRTDDRLKCPNDGRMWAQFRKTPLAIRYLGNPAKKYLYVVGPYDYGFGMYEFDSDASSAIARPAYELVGQQEVHWPPNREGVAPIQWRDSNGDCQYDATEYRDYPNKVFMHGYSVSDEGDLWSAASNIGPGGLVRYPFRGLERATDGGIEKTLPYDFDNPEKMNLPNPIVDVFRIHYESALDRLYVLGRTVLATSKHDNWRLARYDNFHANRQAPSAKWIITLPDDVTDDVSKGCSETAPTPLACYPTSVTVAGDRVYIAQGGNLAWESGRIRAYDAETGVLRNVLKPGPEVAYRSGSLDVIKIHAVAAVQLQDGRRFAFAGDMGRSRILLYRDY